MSDQDDPTASTVEREVAHANAALYEAFEARSIERMGEAWAKSAPVTCVHPGWAPLVGRDAVLTSWANIFGGTARARFRLRDPQVFVRGDAAWVVLVEELALEQAGGERVHALVLATNMLLREPDGVWRIVHHHAGPAPVQEADADPASAPPPSEPDAGSGPPTLH
jgi:ketosteroid isomerase-like protein